MILALTMLLAATPVASQADAAFTTLKTMVGDWEAQVAPDRTLRVSYRLISKDTVLAETWTTPSGTTTMTLFHLDGTRLLATHYCAQGNQPRLKLARVTNGVFAFEYQDATNLKSKSHSHLRRLELGPIDADRLTRRETYVENGKDDVSDFTFTRTRP
jgi:hypothetical protein